MVFLLWTLDGPGQGPWPAPVHAGRTRGTTGRAIAVSTVLECRHRLFRSAMILLRAGWHCKCDVRSRIAMSRDRCGVAAHGVCHNPLDRGAATERDEGVEIGDWSGPARMVRYAGL